MPRLQAQFQARPLPSAPASARPARVVPRPSRRAGFSSAKPAAKSRSPAAPAASPLPRYLHRSASPVAKPDLAKQVPVVREALRQPGQPLSAATRAELEPRLQSDLSAVRIHTTPAAARSATALGAAAYTLGQHIVFGPGRYSPNSPDGRRLLAHEVAHVAQQSFSAPLAPVRPSAVHERQSDQFASSLDAPRGSAPPALTPASPDLQFKSIASDQATAASPGDHFTFGASGPFWFVFYADRFKAVKKLVDTAGKDTGQIGPNWVCNNPGNMTYDPSAIGDKHQPNLAVLSRICRDHGAYSDPFKRTGIPLAIFPTKTKGDDALKAWYTALLTPTHAYWTELGVARGDKTLRQAIGEHAPSGHGGNNPDEYAKIVTTAINQSRDTRNADAREVPYMGRPPHQRQHLSSTSITTVDPSGTARQQLNESDLDALVTGSEKAEGGLLKDFYWEVSDNGALPAVLTSKLSKAGGIPPALRAWCLAHNVTL